MWWKRKPRNRRTRRDQVLEVKVHSQRVRAERWRIAVHAFGVSMGTLLAIFLFWRVGQWSLDNLVYANDDFALRTLDLQTDGVIPVDQLRLWCGVKVGDNLLALDLPTIKRNLELVPLIKDAAVERVLPGVLKIRVTEREPMAQAHVLLPRPTNDGYDVAVYYLDDEAYVMPPMDYGPLAALPGFANDALPILTSLTGSDLRPGRPAESPLVFAALHLITEFERSPMFGVADLSHIDLSSPDVLQVTTGQGANVTLSPERMETQLRRWRTVSDFGARIGKGIASLDLSITNNLPAQWVEASNLPPVKPKILKSSPYRKKHV